MSPYDFGLELNLMLACWLALAAFQKDASTPGRMNFILLCFATAAWCLGDLAALREGLGVETAQRIKYAGVFSLPALWVGLACRAARVELARRVPWFPAVLLAPLLLPYALLFSPVWGDLFLAVEHGGGLVRGPLWWSAASYAYSLVVLGSGILIHSAWRLPSPARDRRLVLGLAACVPLAANALYVSSSVHWLHDPTPVVLGAGLLALRSLLFSGDLLQLLPIPQQDLLHQLPVGLLLTDREGTIVSMNSAAASSLGVPTARAIGRGLDAVLEAAEDPPLFEIAPLRILEREAGLIVMLDPVWAKRPQPETEADPV